MDIISVAVLYHGVETTNYSYVFAYLFLSLISCLHLFAAIGFFVQSYILSNPVPDMAIVCFTGFCEAFYIVAIIASFKTYKEFKALYFEQISQPQVRQSYGGADDERKAFIPFSGQGKRLKDYQ